MEHLYPSSLEYCYANGHGASRDNLMISANSLSARRLHGVSSRDLNPREVSWQLFNLSSIVNRHAPSLVCLLLCGPSWSSECGSSADVSFALTTSPGVFEPRENRASKGSDRVS